MARPWFALAKGVRVHNPLHGVRRADLRKDSVAGLVLGVESVPDGLASGLLAGVNPVSGLYGYLYGMVGAACFTSSTFMAVQATGAMAIIVDDVGLDTHDDPARSLFTLSIVTGLVMIFAGLLGFGRLLRFVPKAVMTGFITAVGVNIALGQLDTFTGYTSHGANRLSRALDLGLHVWRIEAATLAVGVITIVLIVVLRRTRIGAMGLVVAVAAGSAIAAIINATFGDVATVADVADVPNGLPFIKLPLFGEMFDFLVPATSLVFVGLVQGAGVSASIPNPDGTFGDASGDFVGQGMGNVASGLFQGMPVGGSMSASSLLVQAGARSRMALLFAGALMAVVVLVFGGVVSDVAMPSLAALLIFVGVSSIQPGQVIGVAKTGNVPFTVMVITLALTMVIPLQFAVLVGVGIAMILHVLRESGDVTMRRIVLDDDGRLRETAPPGELPAGEVVVLQMYGSVFFANIASFEKRLPEITDASRHSVVIVRARGADDFGATLIEALDRYRAAAQAVGSKLVIVTDNPRIRRQLEVTGTLAALGDANLYNATEWLGETTRRAHADALAWIDDQAGDDG
ncbi:MAG: SulP family inorganic anion transporter [Desertimonas sp.]